MSAFTITSVIHQEQSGFSKTVVLTVTGPASYDANGSILDVSSGPILAAAGATMANVRRAARCGSGATAAALLDLEFIRGTNGDPATGRFVVRSGATETTAATNLSAHTFTIELTGR